MQELLKPRKGANINHWERIQQSAVRVNGPGNFKVAPEVDVNYQTLWPGSIAVNYDVDVLVVT
jgi:hypothetical protein